MATVTRVVDTRALMALLAPGTGLLLQAILWRARRTRAVLGARRGLVLLLPAVLLGIGWLALTAHDRSVLGREFSPVARAPHLLAWAQLAPLPPSAREVAVNSWAFLLSGECYLRFAAEANDIERFLADSAALKGVTCQKYSEKRMRIKSSSYRAAFSQPQDGHEHFYSMDRVPPWYEEEIRGAGRRYNISIREGEWRGELIVNDEQHAVYAHLSRY